SAVLVSVRWLHSCLSRRKADLDALGPEALPASSAGSLHGEECIAVHRERAGEREQGLIVENNEGGNIQVPSELSPPAPQLGRRQFVVSRAVDHGGGLVQRPRLQPAADAIVASGATGGAAGFSKLAPDQCPPAPLRLPAIR